MSKILDKLADQHEERLINTLYRLEDDVIRAVRQATGGSLDKTIHVLCCFVNSFISLQASLGGFWRDAHEYL